MSVGHVDPALRSPVYSELLGEWVPDLFPPLVKMLCDSRPCAAPIDWWLVHAIASACFGHRHLWQDLGLRGREELSSLLAERFPDLYRRNVGDLKWKRFMFHELGQHLGIADLRPPGCGECEHFPLCSAP